MAVEAAHPLVNASRTNNEIIASHRLTIRDPATKIVFLIDSGSDVSIIPRSSRDRKPEELELYAANNTVIHTYGRRKLTVNLGLRRALTWPFIVADTKSANIAADFLHNFNLLIDLRMGNFIDPLTNISISGVTITTNSGSICTINPNAKFYQLLKVFTALCSGMTHVNAIQHNTTHFIETKGLPVFAKARRLSPENLRIAKREFQLMIEQGVCRPSNSSWASPLHMVQKMSGEWRLVGNYRKLNSVTIADRYPISHIHDFAHLLHNKHVFSTTDLTRAYHQISVEESSIAKTAIITPFGLFEFTRIQFGLRNAAQTFQRFMHDVLKGLDVCFPYIDDILIASNNANEHEHHLRKVFERL